MHYYESQKVKFSREGYCPTPVGTGILLPRRHIPRLLALDLCPLHSEILDPPWFRILEAHSVQQSVSCSELQHL